MILMVHFRQRQSVLLRTGIDAVIVITASRSGKNQCNDQGVVDCVFIALVEVTAWSKRSLAKTASRQNGPEKSYNGPRVCLSTTLAPVMTVHIDIVRIQFTHVLYYAVQKDSKNVGITGRPF